MSLQRARDEPRIGRHLTSPRVSAEGILNTFATDRYKYVSCHFSSTDLSPRISSLENKQSLLSYTFSSSQVYYHEAKTASTMYFSKVIVALAVTAVTTVSASPLFGSTS